MKLTVRQKIFLMRFLEYFRKSQKPIHYSALATELGLSKSTTYDMLRLLESWGIIRSIYVVPEKPGKNGRSKVMFLPTELGISLVLRPLGGENADGEQLRSFLISCLEKVTATYDGFWEGWPDNMKALLTIASKEEPELTPLNEMEAEMEDWEVIKGSILAVVKKRKASNPTQVIYELSALTRTTTSPLSLCAEVITAILLTISKVEYRYDAQSPLKMLLDSAVSKEHMILLGGLAWGLSLTNTKARRLLGDFQKDVVTYEESIGKLSHEELLKLHEFTIEVWRYLEEDTESVKKTGRAS